MRIQTKLTLQVALASGALLMVGTGSASAAETVNPDVPDSPLDQLVAQPGLPGVADTINGATDELQALQQVAPAVDLRHPVQALDTVLPAATTPQQRPAPATAVSAPAAVLHMVPLHLLQHDLAPSAEVSGDLPEPDINAPLGSELAATELPVLPATAPQTATPNRSATPPVDDQLPMLPLHGTVSTKPLDPEAGTRVTGLHTSTTPTSKVRPAAPVQRPAMPTRNQRANTPAAPLPLLDEMLPSTPRQEPGALESATALLRK
ncbi:hypothetical protein [Amycolatopsis sp. cmx-4-68]|uniref:hypothetical protein n=1 Tax=Amycolatopsis sp. cmx-4-68 TaxID=2790938 RepID=UPI00397E7224